MIIIRYHLNVAKKYKCSVTFETVLLFAWSYIVFGNISVYVRILQKDKHTHK